MKRTVFFLLSFTSFLIVTCYLLLVTRPVARADEYQDLQKQKEEKLNELNLKEGQKQVTEKKHLSVNGQILNLKSQISNIEKEIEAKKKLIEQLGLQKESKQKDLAQKTEIRNQLIKSFYEATQISPVQLYFGRQTFSQLAQSLAFYKATRSDVQNKVSILGSQVINLKLNLIGNGELKVQLEKDIKVLALKKKDFDLQLASLTSQLSEVKGQISNIQGEIAKITSRQQQILAEKTGGFQTSVGDVPAADDVASRPDFDPGFRPAFAGFSFGAPHRKGMSQYGAWGRAKNGQGYKDILKSYYGDVSIDRRELPGSIQTTAGTMSLEDRYLLGIAEMPASWAGDGGFEALKAQAVAARSYAQRAGKPICITESCQVFKSSKADNPPDAWRRAVNETRGEVVVANGQILSTWYAASSGGYNFAYTSGGFTTGGGWDTKCGSQNCWTGEAYEKISGSPWFYKAWYKPRNRGATRSHPWLTGEEFVDILNSFLLYQKDGSTISHLSQLDKPNPDTWGREEVRKQLSGEAVDRVDSATINYSNGGFTGGVHLETDKGGKDIDGAAFRQIFNLRAPGEIWLASSLFNIEKK